VQDSLRNENNLFNFYGGIKGTLSKRISFNAMASFGRHIGLDPNNITPEQLKQLMSIYDGEDESSMRCPQFKPLKNILKIPD